MEKLTATQIAAIEDIYTIDPTPEIDLMERMVYRAAANASDDGAIRIIRRIVGTNWTVRWSGSSNTDAIGETSADILIISRASAQELAATDAAMPLESLERESEIERARRLR